MNYMPQSLRTKTFYKQLLKSKLSLDFSFPFAVTQYSHFQKWGGDSQIYRIIEVDEFIAELWQVHLKVREEGYTQVCLGIQ